MAFFEKLDRHAGLMGRMAGTLGVDLGAAVSEGRLMPQDLRSMVFSCTGCRDAAACEKFLAGNAWADAAPGFCRNRETMNRLAREG